MKADSEFAFGSPNLAGPIFATRVRGFVIGALDMIDRRDARHRRGPDIPNDNEWSEMAGTARTFGSATVVEGFRQLGQALNVFVDPWE